MKKLIVLLIALSLVGVMGLAFEGTVTVNDQPIEFTLTPNTLDFDALIPGNTNPSTEDITFTVTSANVASVTVAVTEVTGDTVLDDIQVSDDSGVTWDLIENLEGTVNCVEIAGLCTYPNVLIWDAQLFVPLGTPAGTYTQTVTYTINGVAP